MVDYTKRPKSPSSSASTPQAGPSGTPPVNLSKVTLTKSAPTASLTKQGADRGIMTVNLNWNARPAGTGKGILSRLAAGSIDLDLGCLFEMRDGSKGVIQALGNSFGDLYRYPYIFLDGDDRTGRNASGENLFINFDHRHEFKRLLVFAFIYDGVPSWDQAQGVVTLYPVSGQQTEVRLDEEAGGAHMCAIALIEWVGREITVKREIRYIRGGHQPMDRAYNWGMRWTRGSK